MTREEAIEYLDGMKIVIPICNELKELTDERNEAIDMAIEALSVANLKEEFESVGMTREEAIERLNIHKSTSVFVDSIAEAIDIAIEALLADTIPIEKYHELQHQFVMLGAAFTDLTKVVRCKDCRHQRFYINDKESFYCDKSGIVNMHIDDGDGEFFCKYGERKE